MSRASLLVPALAALLGVACAPRTELVIGVATDLSTPGQLDVADLTVRSTSGAVVLHHQWTLGAGATTLPGSVGLVPDDTGAQYLFVLRGGVANGTAADGTITADWHLSRRAQLGFVAGKTLFFRLALSDRCYDTTLVCPVGTACVAGACAGEIVTANRLPVYAAGDETRAQCGDATSAATYHLTPSTATVCAGGGECVDAVCLAPALDDMAASATDFEPPPADASADLAPPSDDAALDLVSADLAAPTSEAGTPVDATAAPQVDATVAPADLPVVDAAAISDAVSPADLTQPPASADAGTTITMSTYGAVSPLPQGEDITSLSVEWSSASGWPVWGATEGGRVLRGDGAGHFTVENPGARAPLRAVLALHGEVWAAGALNAILHRDLTGHWTRLPVDARFPIAELNLLAGDGAGGVIALGTLVSSASTPPPVMVRADAFHTTISDSYPGDVRPVGVYTSAINGQLCGLYVGPQAADFGAIALTAGTTTWSPLMFAPTNQPLSSGFRSVFGCGGNGTTLGGEYGVDQLVGGTWTQPTLPTGISGNGLTPLTGLCSPSDSPTNLYGVAPEVRITDMTSGQTTWGLDVVHFDGANWTTLPDLSPAYDTLVGARSPHPRIPIAAGASSAKTDYVVLAIGSEIFEFTGNGWRATGGPGPAFGGAPWGNGATLVWPAGTEIWATTDLSTWSRVKDTTGATTTVTNGQPRAFHQVFGLASGGKVTRVYAVSDYPAEIISASDLAVGFDTVEFVHPDPTSSFLSVWAADTTHVYAGGQGGNSGGAWVFSNRSGAWQDDHVLPTQPSGIYSYPFGSLIGFGPDDVFTAGNYGGQGATIFHRDASGWKDGPHAGTNLPFYSGLWGTSGTDLWTLAAIQYVPLLLSHQTDSRGPQLIPTPMPPDSPTFGAIAGSGDGVVYLGGSHGHVLRYDGKSWSAIDTGTVATIDGLWVDAKNLWIGGGGRLLRLAR